MSESEVVPKRHAMLSPSSADRWMTCPGSVRLSAGIEQPESEYAIEGTDHHEAAAVCLEQNLDARALIGGQLPSGAKLTEEGAEFIQVYLDAVRGYAAAVKGTIAVEEEVPIGWCTGEKDATGTADAVILSEGPEMIVVDFKYGRRVQVEAQDNRQLRMYAIGELEKHQLWDHYERVRTAIVQPRAGGISEAVYTIKELRHFAEEVHTAALRVHKLRTGKDIDVSNGTLVPSVDACRFCPARAICPALTKKVTEGMTLGFADETSIDQMRAGAPLTSEGDRLGQAMDLTDLMEIWLRAVRARVESELLSGKPITGKDGAYKLVLGRAGARKWTSEDHVEALCDSLRLSNKERYDMKLISPTTAEKRFKKEHPKKWERFIAFITQAAPSKSVAAATDPRQAIVINQTEGFSVEDGTDLI